MPADHLVAQITAAVGKTQCPVDDDMAVLWALARGRDDASRDGLTAAEVAAVVTTVGRRSMSRQATLGILNRLADGPAVHRRKRRKAPDVFTIMGHGDDLLGASASVVLVDPARALQEVRDLEDVLANLKGKVAICDPYLDSRTLDFVAAIKGATSIRFLTERVTDSDRMKRELKAVVKQTGANVDVRVATKGILHDRYIMHGGGMLVLGTSLNSFGLKQSFISKVGHDVAKATAVFYETVWKTASPL